MCGNKVTEIFNLNHLFFYLHVFVYLYSHNAPSLTRCTCFSVLPIFGSIPRKPNLQKLGSLVSISQHFEYPSNSNSGVFSFIPSALEITRSPVEIDVGVEKC